MLGLTVRFALAISISMTTFGVLRCLLNQTRCASESARARALEHALVSATVVPIHQTVLIAVGRTKNVFIRAATARAYVGYVCAFFVMRIRAQVQRLSNATQSTMLFTALG